MKYRIGLDVGTNSLGWSVLKLNGKGEVTEIEAAGSRIFSDGRDNKSKATLAADRREARSARRRRDRYIQRRTYLINALTQAGLFPKDEETRKALQKLNPLELRARLLTESTADILADIKKRSDKTGEAANHSGMQPEYLVGRALFHLNQRRGFKSSRKDRSEETTSGKVSSSVRGLLQEMGLIDPPMPPEEYKELSKEDKKRERQREAEARKEALDNLETQKDLSFGSFLYQRHKQKEQTRARPGAGDDGKLYDVYPSRELYEDEFSKIWNVQAKDFSQQMTNKENFYKIIFTQRPLKPQKRGKCTYMPDYDRTFRAMPSFQRYRIYQEVNNLEWATAEGRHCLTDYREARNKIIDLLENPPPRKSGEIAPNKQIAWRDMKKVLKQADLVEGNIEFNCETPKRKGFDGNLTSNVMQHEDYVGPDWHAWDLEKQDEFVDTILNGTPEHQKRNKESEEARKAGKKISKDIADGSQDDKKIADYLVKHFDLSEHTAKNCVNAQLPEGTANISKEAALLMLEKMRDGIEGEPDKETGEVKTVLPNQHYAAKACSEEYPQSFCSKGDNKELQDSLPYYGKWFFEDGRHIIPGDRLPEDEGDDRKFYGGVTNPTVHIALNQIRQVINEMIDRFGHPHSIAVELGRELPEGKDYQSGLDGVQAKNQERNRAYDKELDEEWDKAPTSLNRLLLRLWKEQDKRCPYCFDKIGGTDLFGGGVDIDHILPRKTLDDSPANKVVCHRECNHFKSDKTPWEAFHNGFKDKSWNEIYENAAHIKYEVPRFNRKLRRWEPDIISKQWRFQENAMALQQGDGKEIEKIAKKMATNDNDAVKGIAEKILRNGVASLSEKEKIISEKHGIPHKEFSERHLNDTRYIGRLTREYLEAVCHIDQINVVTGRLTSLLRGHWGLNGILKELANEAEHPADHNQPEGEREEKSTKKNRDDHRHHAIDAIVIGMTNRSILQKVSTAANKAEELELDRLFPKDESGHSAIDPWSGFRNDVKETVRNITVSHKAKKKKLHPGKTTDGQLHNETALGLIKPINEAKNEWKTVVRRPIDYFKERKHVEAIRDDKWRLAFVQAFDDAEAVGKKGAEGVLDLANDEGIRRLRCYGPKQAIPIRDKNGKAYKGYQGDSNWGMEIYAFPEGHKKADKWEGVVISRYDANKPGFQPGTTYRPHPEARLVMRLQINDCIEIEEDGKEPRILYFVKCNQAGTMFFADHNEANLRKRNDDKLDNFKYFQKTANALKPFSPRKVHISPTGQVNYEKRGKKHKRRQKE